MHIGLYRRTLFRLSFLLAVMLAILPAAAARAALPHDSVTLSLVAYSTPQEAYGLIIPAFQKTKAGAGVSFKQSYGASGDQSIAVGNGLPADIVAFSLEPDIGRLVSKGLVAPNWYKNKYHGFVTDSVVVFVVRQGNPKHIKTWNDLVKPGVDVITPNPFTSGGARWNVMAAYGAQLAQHKSAKQATAYLQNLFSHVSVQDTSARAELQTFVGGKGDVMLAYENEAITAQEKGQKLDYVIPPQTILIENPVAVTKTTSHTKEANAFLQFLWSTRGQQLFAAKGYRPVVPSVAKTYHFKKPKTLFTIRSFGLGGWSKVQPQFFDPQKGVMATIERNKGAAP
ncbi:MAG TPA: sulfate ABC transporter substrate-binding protein [Chloroflexota bacterium]